uniref:Putative ovule protein n=1 Tax=Solanum chacoense TaxID=4108 RepID=A0A0V0HH06_SOLCH
MKHCTIFFSLSLFIRVIYGENMKQMKCLMICANVTKPFQHLPVQCARANDLTNKKCGLIIRDGRKRQFKADYLKVLKSILEVDCMNSVLQMTLRWEII